VTHHPTERAPFSLERALRLQSITFILLSAAIISGGALLPRMGEQTELIILAVLIVILGAPHGALDPIFAHRLYKISTRRAWLLFTTVYCLVAGLVVVIWFFTPFIFLCIFLIISVAHFSGDPLRGTLWSTRLAHGGAIIALPSLFYEQDIARLLGFLTGPEAVGELSGQLAYIAPFWLIGMTVCVMLETRKSALRGAELFAVGLLAILAPPLIAFTIFFCGMHSARHILRTADYARVKEPYILAAAGLLPMAGVFAALTVAWFFMSDIQIDQSVIQIVFVGLAALTVPHMALVERVRFSGWSRSL